MNCHFHDIVVDTTRFLAAKISKLEWDAFPLPCWHVAMSSSLMNHHVMPVMMPPEPEASTAAPRGESQTISALATALDTKMMGTALISTAALVPAVTVTATRQRVRGCMATLDCEL
jgi:hypothetical protein